MQARKWLFLWIGGVHVLGQTQVEHDICKLRTKMLQPIVQISSMQELLTTWMRSTNHLSQSTLAFTAFLWCRSMINIHHVIKHSSFCNIKRAYSLRPCWLQKLGSVQSRCSLSTFGLWFSQTAATWPHEQSSQLPPAPYFRCQGSNSVLIANTAVTEITHEYYLMLWRQNEAFNFVAQRTQTMQR